MKEAYDNYNLFLVSIGALFLSLAFNGWKHKMILSLCILLLLCFSYNQFKYFTMDEINSYTDGQVIFSNIAFALLTIYLCYYIFRHRIIQ